MVCRLFHSWYRNLRISVLSQKERFLSSLLHGIPVQNVTPDAYLQHKWLCPDGNLPLVEPALQGLSFRREMLRLTFGSCMVEFPLCLTLPVRQSQELRHRHVQILLFSAAQSYPECKPVHQTHLSTDQSPHSDSHSSSSNHLQIHA